MEKSYNPKLVEEKIYKFWLKTKYFNPDKLPKTYKSKPYFTTLLPPPNITGSLHLGHALNSTIIDILIRYNRLNGKRAVCLPGTDHAGIATQNVVEKKLKQQNQTRFDIGREKFIQLVWKWKNKYGEIILEQLKKLGLSADFSRNRFTMDEKYSKQVQQAFVHYFKKGLIYRKKRVINWCPRCQTSLSDLELKYRQEKTKLYYLRYPIQSKANKAYVVVATTRPETMLGDTAVAVNPKDKRYQKLIGKAVILPLVNRKIKIIAEPRVDPEFGTGAVKVTPAHDLLDAEIGEKNNLEVIQVINQQGRMNENALNYQGQSTQEARVNIVKDLQKQGLIEKIEPYTHNVAVCYRCETKIEPIPSLQWFLKMDDLAKLAKSAVKSGQVKIIPKRFEKIYFDWLNNIKDWCISRQIWWGHRLPVWFCQKNQDKFVTSLKKPKTCPFCKKCNMQQSNEVLDTWFSSALWPFAGLSKPDLKKFYPSDTLVTARDIINLWVARMIFSGLEFQQKKPFSKVFIHPTILTKEGKRMSKSLGTGIDPLNLIENFGADALRFGIIWQVGTAQDIHWDETAVVAGKKLNNKIWNAARFVLQQLSKHPKTSNTCLNLSSLTKADKSILSELRKTKKVVKKYIENFQFGFALRQIYQFFWHKFCDKYIETSKIQIRNPKTSKSTKKVLLYVLKETLKILHPFIPFITEEIYQKLPKSLRKRSLMIESLND